MSKFEDRLWRQLVREHGSDLAQMRRPAAKHAWRSRPRMLAGTTLGLAGIGTAAALLLGAASSSPAFAVTRNSDGTVSVSIDRLSGIAGANQKLASLGIRAKAVAVGAGCDSNWTVSRQVIQAGSERKPDTAAQLRKLAAVRAAAAARIDPGKIPAGHTVVIAAWRAGQQVRVYASRAVAGPPPRVSGARRRRGQGGCSRQGRRSDVQPPGTLRWRQQREHRQQRRRRRHLQRHDADHQETQFQADRRSGLEGSRPRQQRQQRQ